MRNAALPALLAAALAALCAVAGRAQVLTPVTWTFSTEVADGKTFLVFDADIDDGWYVYSQFLESDDGPNATTIEYDTPGAARLVGASAERGGRKAGYDELFGMNVVKFERDFVIRQEVEFAGADPVLGYLTFMTCDDEKCLPPTDVDFRFAPPVASAAASPAARSGAKPPSERNLVTAENDAPPAIVAAVEQARAEVAQEGAPKKVVRPGMLQPVTWTVSAAPVAGEDGVYTLRWVADIEPGWTLYSQDVAEDGPVPTSFAFDTEAGYARIGAVSEDGKRKSGFDAVFGVDVTKYLAPRATFAQTVRVSDPAAPIVGYLEYMTCDDAQCLPPTEEFWRFVPARGVAELLDLDAYEAAIARASGGAAAAPPTANDPLAPGATALAPGGDRNANYVINKELGDATCGDEARETDVDDDASLLTVFLLGFGGGLLALLTPCVFPMIPLTVSFFTGRGKDRARGLRRALIYGASIIGIYVTLGLAITGMFGADALNQLSTNAWFNLAFGVLFIVFALSFFGFFEITLPSSWANKTDRAADQGGLLGIFFMAFTLSLVSFSCTGPIIGTLLVETATGGGATILGRVPVAPLVGMLGFSTALALPFTLFAAFPAALASLPKSGGWMNTVKVTLGFVEVALAMKFLSTADLIMGTKWLPYEVFVGVWLLCALGLAAYYFGWLKTPLEKYGGGHRVGNLMLGLGAATLAFAVYVATGFGYSEKAGTFKTPFLLSGLAPPAGHSYVYKASCPQGIACFKDYDEAKAFAKTVDKPLLVDFTGHGCVNCRKMEDNVWDKPGVYERIKNDFVLVSLYVDERRELADSAKFVSEFSGQRIRTVGNKWADFQARYFDRNSQPYYVLMSPEGDVLNQPVPYTPDVEEYAAFLDCGLQQFERLRSGGDASDERLGGL